MTALSLQKPDDCERTHGSDALSFASKLMLFTSDRLGPDDTISIPDLAGLGLSQNPKYLAGVMFETAAAVSSPVIAAPHSVFVGAYSYVNDGGYIRDHVMIGRYCSIGRRVSIGAGMHAMSGVSTSPFLNVANGSAYTPEQLVALGLAGKRRRGRYTIISHDVWIGDGAIVMPGVTIGTGAVVGANSVVTHDVADYAIVAGLPARQIGLRFDPQTVQRLLASEYWELPHEILKAMPAANVLAFLTELERSDFQREAAAAYRTMALTT